MSKKTEYWSYKEEQSDLKNDNALEYNSSQQKYVTKEEQKNKDNLELAIDYILDYKDSKKDAFANYDDSVLEEIKNQANNVQAERIEFAENYYNGKMDSGHQQQIEILEKLKNEIEYVQEQRDYENEKYQDYDLNNYNNSEKDDYDSDQNCNNDDDD